MVRIDDKFSAIQILVTPLYILTSASLSMWAYLCSTDVKVREAYAMGRSVSFSIRCASTAPSPSGKASRQEEWVRFLHPVRGLPISAQEARSLSFRTISGSTFCWLACTTVTCNKSA